ncbi:MAG: lytic transglycosylase domain-containing protein [Acidobacteriota bacterium]|nr:lytic transglycosylase domain-containing protein [Acidobacteriota bacterium]
MSLGRTWQAALVASFALCATARAAEHITLRNGFAFDCARQEPAGDSVRLYLVPTSAGSAENTNYIEVPAASIARTEPLPELMASQPPAAPASAQTPATQTPATQTPAIQTPATAIQTTLTPAELHQLLAHAGETHNIDADLLASLVLAESANHPRAVSRAGAQGLMQLMPSTAATLGVTDSFAPDQNIGGGTAYLDQLLTRYHDNLALALAAYNAGPTAVDRHHGIPPYTETRVYVARVIREFNRRKRATPSVASLHPAAH